MTVGQKHDEDVNDDGDDNDDDDDDKHLNPALLKANGKHLPLRRVARVATQAKTGHLVSMMMMRGEMSVNLG